MSEINLLLVRHGEAAESWGKHPDPGLSELGIKQSASLVNNKMLESLDSYTFVSSPKLRAKMTAEPLIKKFNKGLIVHDASCTINPLLNFLISGSAVIFALNFGLETKV